VKAPTLPVPLLQRRHIWKDGGSERGKEVGGGGRGEGEGGAPPLCSGPTACSVGRTRERDQREKGKNMEEEEEAKPRYLFIFSDSKEKLEKSSRSKRR